MNRQRKLTWLERKQIEKVAFDHPFFDVPGTILSRKEAKEIIRSAENRKTGTQIVTEAYAKLGVPYSASIDKRPSLLDNLKEIFSVPAIRRLGIIAIAIILLVVFFAATPIGRSIAESVIKYFVTLFDDGRLVMNQNGNETQLVLMDNENEIGGSEQEETGDGEQQDILTAFIYINSFEEFTKATGKTPYVLPLSFTELYYEYDEIIDYLVLYSMYETPDGKIAACQIWDIEDAFSTTLTGYEPVDGDKTIFYSIEEDGYIYCKKILEDSFFTISSKGNFSLDYLINMLTEE